MTLRQKLKRQRAKEDAALIDWIAGHLAAIAVWGGSVLVAANLLEALRAGRLPLPW